jgi:PKD repeat protein
MHKFFTIILLFSCISAGAQLSEGGLPYSFEQTQLKTKVIVPEHKLSLLNEKKLKEEDTENPTPFRYSSFEEVHLDIKTGVISNIDSPKGNIWRYAISSENAFSIQLYFKSFIIPTGAKLFIYNEDYSEVYGAFTNKNINSDSSFIIADFPGQKLTIEYFEPDDAEFKGSLILGSIGQAYQDILQNIEKNVIEQEYVDINCNEGKNWQHEKHAVCKITFKVGQSGYLCSGALINNTANDAVPYFLTANHCISDTTVAKTLVAYFNYERRWCKGPVDNGRTLSGSRLMTTGQKSDYTLLKLNNTPPASYTPYYAGWDIGNYNDNQNTGIHHPEGIEKKISIDNDKIITYDFPISWDEGETTPPSSHWRVIFDVGWTSEGSSGGPLFSKQKRIIGQLHGGGEGEEFYGKLSYSWTNSSSGYDQLKKFLDPKNTGVTLLNGYYPSNNPPDAFFSARFTEVCLNSPVTLQDNSAFLPTSRNWTITPGTFTYLNGTNNNSPDPQVSFNAAGNYTIKLNVANTNGKDSLVFTNALKAGTGINVSMRSNMSDTLCSNGFDSLMLTGFGAESYAWVLDSPNPPFYFSRISQDTAILKKNNLQIDSSYSLKIITRGVMGSCSATASKTIRFIKVFNDNIMNAIEIGLGLSKQFSNLCATIEANEPIPLADSCTGVKSWCDEYGDGKRIVENSVWFKFKGPSTGKASLKSSGFDNEIAIYDAASYQDILAGRYTLLAANDDQSDTNSNPFIPAVNVQPGKTYWIQVDGSGGGSEGSFTLTLSDKIITSSEVIIEDTLFNIYPQPASSILNIDGLDPDNDIVDLKIFGLTGKVMIEQRIKNEGDKLSVNIENLSPGIYLLKISQNNQTFVKKFIKN